MGSNTFSACLRLQLATLLLLSSSGASSALAAGSTSASAAACPTGAAEHRTYEIVVDKKPAGAYSLNIAKLPDGSISVTSKASVRVKVLFFTYGYDYAGHEVWKNDRLVAFDSQSQENGKKTNVKVATEGERISYTINGGKPRYATAETRTSSYWQLPSSTTSGEFSSGFIEVDTGRTFKAKMQKIGTERILLDQKNSVSEMCSHYQLSGEDNCDIWYDHTGRIVRQVSTDDGHTTTVQLLSRS